MKHNEIEKALDQHKTYVACLESDPDFIIGYAVQTKPIFCFVRVGWRGIGIEEALEKEIK